MSSEVQYLQTQLNELQDTMSAHKILVSEAIDKAGENKRALEAAHSRLDAIKSDLLLVRNGQLTKKDFEEILEVSFNKRLVLFMKRVVFTTIAVAFTAGVTWVVEHLTVK